MQTDKQLLDTLITKFYSVFKNTNGQVPNWNFLSEACLPQLCIIKKTGLSEEVYDINSFVTPRIALLSNGSLIDFEEKEISETTVITGHMAQRYSRYTKKGSLNGTAFEQNGVKLFQCIKTKTGWQISAIVWEDEQL